MATLRERIRDALRRGDIEEARRLREAYTREMTEEPKPVPEKEVAPEPPKPKFGPLEDLPLRRRPEAVAALKLLPSASEGPRKGRMTEERLSSYYPEGSERQLARTLQRIESVDPRLARAGTELLWNAARAGMPSYVTSGRRTAEEQRKLYEQGRTKPGRRVTPLSGRPGQESQHQFGRALDLVFAVPRAGFSYQGPWSELGALGQEQGLTWGGGWQNPDRPHFELPQRPNLLAALPF